MGLLREVLDAGGVAVPDSDRRRRSLRWSTVAALIGLAVLVVAGLFAKAEGVPNGVLTREPQVVLDGAYYTGIVSNIGALVWMVGVTVCAVGVASTVPGPRRTLFVAGCASTLVLLIDDFFLVHDAIDRDISGPADKLFLAALFVLAAAVPWFGRRELGVDGVVGLLAGLGFFALSGAIDTLAPSFNVLVEDGAKFLGICLWSTTWVLQLRALELRPSVTPPA